MEKRKETPKEEAELDIEETEVSSKLQEVQPLSLPERHRWKVLVLICLFRTATYYCADIPSTMQGEIMKDYNINSTQYGLVTAMLSIPTIFTSFFTGILVDKVGSLSMMMPLILLVSLGMAIQTASAYYGDYLLLLLGRFVFALGYESINVLKGIIVSDWFFGAEMSTANSINLSFVRGIVFVSGAFTPMILERSSLTGTFVAGCIVCLLSIGATSFLMQY